MDVVFSQTQIIQLIALSLRKIIPLPVMLPSTNGFNKLIETLEKRSKKNGLLTCKRLLTYFACPLFESIKSTGGMSTKPNFEEKKM